MMRTVLRRLTLKNVLATAATLLGVAVAVFPAYAQTGPDLGLEYATTLGLTTQDVRVTIGRIINAFLGFLGIVVVLIMLYAGFLWMTAGGNEEKVSKAKKWMVNGVIGLVIILSAFAITQFLFRAITGSDQLGGGGGPGGCPPGQNCGLPGGGAGGFRVEGIVPSGPGPNDGGWPKNYAITIGFNAAVAEATVNPSTIDVRKCNPRINGDGDPQPFNEAACTDVVSGTRTVQGSKVIFKPDSSPEDDPTDFEGEFWYKVRVQGQDVKDTLGRPLFCPLTPPGPEGDISSSSARRDLCDRAIAYNNLRDVLPPNVSVQAPKSPPGVCNPLVRIRATATDDFLVGSVDFRLDGSTVGLVDSEGTPISTATNGDLLNPFLADTVFIDTGVLTPGQTYTVTAVAYDGVPQASAPAESQITISPAHCCNGIQDADLGETGIDCGETSGCGLCGGSSCTEDAQCASGYCNPATGMCEERPVIEDISPGSGGPGTLVTISGRFFGSSPGNIIFLGGDTDSDGEVEGDDDDVIAQACADSAWGGNEIVVAVPVGAVAGPIKVLTASGQSDRSDDDHGPAVPQSDGAFTITGVVSPGICYLAPNFGTHGASFTIHGTGFGDTIGASIVRMDGVTIDIAPPDPAAVPPSVGWTAGAVTAIVPPVLPVGSYPVRVLVGGPGGDETNAVNFALRLSADETQPRIVELDPVQGPRDSYVTIIGTGFGARKGLVRFYSTSGAKACSGGDNDGTVCVSDTECTGGGHCITDVAIAGDPICDDNWKDNYIIVKVPKKYQSDITVREEVHQVEVETASPSKTSNRVPFTVVGGPATPGMCAIAPDNGPPGINVTVTGERFGNPDPADVGTPSNSVEFYVDSDTTMSADAYGPWTGTEIRVAVPGERADKDTWPNSGPVSVIASNLASSNSVPFLVQDCNEPGATCPGASVCCANGSCEVSTPEKQACEPISRNSAFGWTFSTNVLPSLPVVIERALCDADQNLIQSPTPFRGETSACKNALAAAEISKVVLPASYTLDSVKLVECGNGPVADCSAPVTVPVDGTQLNITAAAGDRSIVSFRPAPSYPPDGPDAATGNFRSGYWYRATLISNTSTVVGITDADGRLLDGDRDRTQGGDFRWDFKVRDDPAACALSRVAVLPSPYTITHKGLPSTGTATPSFSGGFDSMLFGANCNILACDADNYNITWNDIPPPHLTLLTPTMEGCRQPVIADAETTVASPVELTASVTPTGETLVREGTALVSVKFADPRVVSVEPTAGCTDTCINAKILAKFNVAMDITTFTPGNYEIFRCRNAACNAPFQATLGGSVVLQSPEGEPSTEDLLSPGNFTQVNLPFEGLLEPSTFYLVRIKAGTTGVKSQSGVALTGLNAPGYYQWKFRTKDDPTACAVDRVAISPPRAMLRFVGQRIGLTTTAYGPVDECSPSGQSLNANAYSWDWDADPNPIIDGFIRQTVGFPSPPQAALSVTWPPPLAQLVDTDVFRKRGCTKSCLLTGSQNVVPQCGNGLREVGEDCDTAIPEDSARCTSQCLWDGLSPTCGNDVKEVGEACESVAGEFPPGCKDPAEDIPDRPDLDGMGCVALGSDVTPGSVCGDGFISDGESCDDGNSGNGDGCSRQCVNEGSLPGCSFATPPNVQCVSFCGNGLDEPGEDPDCDGPGGVAPGCNPATCLKTGTAPPLCGNGVVDPGEDDECEQDPGIPEFCSSSCLLLGSSAGYGTAQDPKPSFCGDGLVGYGEKSVCEQSMSGDDLKDRYQVAVSGNYDPQSGPSTTSTVTATTEGVPPGGVGQAQVTLSCTCKTLPTKPEQDLYCSNIGVQDAGLPPDTLACADSGCCITRPMATLVDPGDNIPPLNGRNDACRNQAIAVNFDRMMDTVSVQQNLLVGYDSGGTSCPDGVEELPASVASAGSRIADRSPSLWTRVWNAVTGFFRWVFGGPALGVPAQDYGDAEDNAFCLVEGKVIIRNIDGAEPGEYITQALYHQKNALPANTWFKVWIGGGAKDTQGVSMQPGVIGYFGTRADICPLDRVSVFPESTLFSKISERDKTFIAIGETEDSDAIVPTEDYGWRWNWWPHLAADLGAIPPGAEAPPMVLAPQSDGGVVSDMALGYVRGRETTDDPPGYIPKNGHATVIVEAEIIDPDTAAVTRTVNCQDTAGGSSCGQVEVMLCDNPWPSWRVCDVTNVTELPWALGTPHACPNGSRLWFPFFDEATNLEFFYCRDGQGGGDTDPTLPAFNEKPVRLINPAPDIIREYLFTYDLAQGPSGAQAWSDDAIGFRVLKNTKHRSIADWYTYKGFRGNPSSIQVDGYEALKEGRTSYVNAASVTDTNEIWTNINVLSHNDNAEAETTAIYNQLLTNVNFNRQPDLRNLYICRDAVTDSAVLDDDGRVVYCGADLHCGGADYCEVPKSKLRRDVRRWVEMHSIRSALNALLPYPKLEAGTYIRARTYSAWPSWSEVLSKDVGSALPADPLNDFAECAEGADEDTCWDSSSLEFACPAQSHVYRYLSVGTNAHIQADLEFEIDDTALWRGDTCIDLDNGACTSPANSGECEWLASKSRCQYKDVQIWLGGFNTSPMCVGTPEGGAGDCGDGIVQSGEECEPGMVRSVPATPAQCGSDTSGLQPQRCRDVGEAGQCTWVNEGACIAGSCGNGVVESPEVCDDGALNGTYGHCNISCTSNTQNRCGDGIRQPSETCDCGTNNGVYRKDGILQPLGQYPCTAVNINYPSCNWDCSAAGPRCGDGIVNNTAEECDGDVQQAEGYCEAVLRKDQVACTGPGTCPDGLTCRMPDTVDQHFRRSCNANDPSVLSAQDCKWGAWTQTAPGECGNGVKESGEECDDGNDTNLDTCTNACKNNVCGDGYVNFGIEQCDDGAFNNQPCVPLYGLTCNYCKSSCQLGTVSGGFCGDGVVQGPLSFPVGPEVCDNFGAPLGGNKICISTKPEEQSFGYQKGVGICSTSQCKPGCAALNAEVCDNNPASGNYDNDECTPYIPDSSDFCNDTRGGEDGWLSTYGDPPGNILYDACDPDDDNDGVPDIFDCAPKDPYTHQSYTVPETGVTISAGIEFCDGVDNDCNGLVDDDWTIEARPDQTSLSFQGQVVDAYFPDTVPIMGATVIAQRGLCSVDKVTQCDNNVACGGGTCNSFGKCSHNNATCGSDLDCGGTNGVCGISDPVKDKKDVTDAMGRFEISNVRTPSATCKMVIQVNPFKPASDLNIAFMTASPDELEERSGRGYFAQALPIPPGSSGTIYYDGGNGAGHQERLLLIPVPRPGKAVLALIWKGRLPGYLDAYLSVPGNGADNSCQSTGTDAGSDPDPICPNPLAYYNQGQHRLTDNPWGRLVCDSDGGGDPTSCGSFYTSPELMVFQWGGPINVADNQKWKFYLDDYSNRGGNIWRDINGAKPYVIGGFNNGFAACVGGTSDGGECSTGCPGGTCEVDPNSVAGGTLGPIYAPGAGYAKYWHVVDWVRCDHAGCGASWNISIPNQFVGTAPSQP